MGLQVIGHNQSIWGIQNYSFSESVLDFDSLYKFEMTLDL